MTELKLFSEKLNSISGSREEFIAFLESKKSDVLDNETKVFMENFKKETAQKNIKNVDEYLLASYYYSVLKDNNVKEDSYKDYSINLDKLVEFDNYVVENQKFRIKNYWYDIRSRALNIFANDNNIKAVYNLRKNAQFSKINTLREIISMDKASIYAYTNLISERIPPNKTAMACAISIKKDIAPYIFLYSSSLPKSFRLS